MKKFTLPIATIITFILIPLLGLIFRIYRYSSPHLNYGDGAITVNSVLLLLFAIYAIVVSASHFIQCNNSWKTGNSPWKVHLLFTYIYVFTIALSLFFLMIFEDIDFTKGITKIFCISPLYLLLISITLFFLVLTGLRFLKKSSKLYLLVIFSIFITVILLPLIAIFVTEIFNSQEPFILALISAAFLFPIGFILLYLCFVGLNHIGSGAMPYLFMIILIPVLIVIIYVRYFSPVFILPSGIILLFLGIGGFKQLKAKPKIYLFITFLMSLLFLLGAAVPAFMVFVWWIKGGINPW